MTTTTTFEKSIRYDRTTRDYRAELDGQLIGYFPSYHAAEVALDQVAYDRLADEQAVAADEAAQVDADVMPADVALHILGEINQAEAIRLAETRKTHASADVRADIIREWQSVIDRKRTHLNAYGYHTQLSEMTGAYVPSGNGHGWQYVSGQRVQTAAPAAESCPFCEAGVIPNGSGTGELSGGWADVCDTCGGSGKLMPLGPAAEPVCMCGAPATLIIHDGPMDIASCERCFELEYENDHESSRSWTVDPIAADPPTDPDPGPGGDPWPDAPSIFRPVVAPSLLDEADVVLTAQLGRRDPGAIGRRACLICDGDHSAEDCPRIRFNELERQAFDLVARISTARRQWPIEATIESRDQTLRYHHVWKRAMNRWQRRMGRRQTYFCRACAGMHATQRCPRIWRELRRPAEMVYAEAA